MRGLLLLPLLAGCADTFRVMNTDPVRVELITAKNDALIATVSLTAERRTVLVQTSGEHRGRFCAEPPPDVATDLLTSLRASLSHNLTAAQLQTLYAETVVKLADRPPALDVYRTGTYVLCQYYLNGAMNEKQLQENFQLLTTAVTQALQE